MDPTSPLEAVEHFDDFHPISAARIFNAVAARHIPRDDITQAVLRTHDQGQDRFVGLYPSGVLSGALVVAVNT